MQHNSGYQFRSPNPARFSSGGTTGLGNRFSGFKPQSPRNFAQKTEATPEQLMEGLGKKIATIPMPSSTVGQSRPVSIDNVEEVASYSWLDKEQPTIVVPGSPPVWRERPMPYRVPRDSGTVFLDQNTTELSASPLLPLIAATIHHAPKFPLSSVDFVTDRNGLRKLWRWAAGKKCKNFRIDVELVGKGTVLMERWEPFMTQRGGPGYEREFEKASTTPGKGCEEASCHHRIIIYDLDGLKMLVRFKADATLPHDDSDVNNENQDPLESLASHLGNLSVSTNTGSTECQIPTFGGKFLTIISGGTLVPQASLVELKTRTMYSVTPPKNFLWGDTYPQLLLSQTPHVFVCVHEGGEFQEVRKTTLADLEKRKSARNSHEILRTLRMALGEIQNLMKEREAGKLSLVCNGGKMSLHETTGSVKSLPPDILKEFNQ